MTAALWDGSLVGLQLPYSELNVPGSSSLTNQLKYKEAFRLGTNISSDTPVMLI